MDYSNDIVNLYSGVFSREIKKFGVTKGDIFKSNKNISDAYSANPSWKGDYTSKSADFNDASHRSAYLHKYAMLHTGLLCNVLEQALQIYSVHSALYSKEPLCMCSLGSGPGTDIVSLLFVLQKMFGPVPCKATLVDRFVQWRCVFDAIVYELRNSTQLAHFKDIVPSQKLEYEYMEADLLKFDSKNRKVCESISNADIITMVKFISAAACKDTENMVKKIFALMKPGALLLFIDNDAGGFHEAMSKIAKTSGMDSVFGPLKHYEYQEPLFDRIYEDHLHAQHKTRVRAEIWQKEVKRPQNTTGQLWREFFRKSLGGDEVDCPMPKADGSCETGGENFHLVQENPASSDKEKGCCIIM